MDYILQKISADNGNWSNLLTGWERACATFDEEFRQYAITSIPVLKEFAEAPKADTAVYGLALDGDYHAIFLANNAHIPNFEGKVLRIRHLTLSPKYDFGDYDVKEYINILVEVVLHAVNLSINELKSQHIKIHLRSPADRQFFASFGVGLDKAKIFTNVRVIGSWLFISK